MPKRRRRLPRSGLAGGVGPATGGVSYRGVACELVGGMEETTPGVSVGWLVMGPGCLLTAHSGPGKVYPATGWEENDSGEIPLLVR